MTISAKELPNEEVIQDQITAAINPGEVKKKREEGLMDGNEDDDGAQCIKCADIDAWPSILHAKLPPIRVTRELSHDYSDVGTGDQFEECGGDDGSIESTCNMNDGDSRVQQPRRGGGRRSMTSMSGTGALAIPSPSSCGSPFSSHASIRRRFLLSLASDPAYTANRNTLTDHTSILLSRLNICGGGGGGRMDYIVDPSIQQATTLTNSSRSIEHAGSAIHVDHVHESHRVVNHYNNNTAQNGRMLDIMDLPVLESRRAALRCADHAAANPGLAQSSLPPDLVNNRRPSAPCAIDHINIDRDHSSIPKCSSSMLCTTAAYCTDPASIKDDHSCIPNYDQYEPASTTTPKSSGRMSPPSSATTRLSQCNGNSSAGETLVTKFHRFISNCTKHMANSCPRAAKRFLLCCLHSHQYGRQHSRITNSKSRMIRRQRSNSFTVGYSPIFGTLIPLGPGVTINSSGPANMTNNNSMASSSPGRSSRSSVNNIMQSAGNQYHSTIISPRRSDHQIISGSTGTSGSRNYVSGTIPSPSPSPRLARRDSNNSNNSSSGGIKRGIGRGVMTNHNSTMTTSNCNDSYSKSSSGRMIMNSNPDPTSPTVTCIGKIRREAAQCRTWSATEISSAAKYHKAKKNINNTGKENIIIMRSVYNYNGRKSQHMDDDDAWNDPKKAHMIYSSTANYNRGQDLQLL